MSGKKLQVNTRNFTQWVILLTYKTRHTSIFTPVGSKALIYHITNHKIGEAEVYL